MPTQKEFDDLKALVERIAATPKVKAYLDGGQWPRPVKFGEGLITPVNEAQLAVPKSKQLVSAEKAVEDAQAAYDAAVEAWRKACEPESGRFAITDSLGMNPVVVDVAPAEIISARTDIPEFAAKEDAERKLVRAKVRLYSEQKRRDAEVIRFEQKQNPSPNPSKGEPPSLRRMFRI